MSGITLAATHGLVAFRTKAPDIGRQLYKLAIERANKLGIKKYSLMADLYLAREEVLASTSAAPAAVKQALAKACDSPKVKSHRFWAIDRYHLERACCQFKSVAQIAGGVNSSLEKLDEGRDAMLPGLLCK